MAGDWIPMRLDLRDDPAVMQIADSMDVREEVVVGYLHSIWSWVSRNCHGARVTGVTLLSLGRVTNLHGFPQLMRDVGWLDEGVDEQGRPYIEIPHWDRWLSNTAKNRRLSTERQRKYRNSDKLSNGGSVTSVANVSRIERDKSVTTEEKRREEKNITLTHSSSENPSVNSRQTPLVAYEALHSDDVRKLWDRWMDFVFRQLGRYMDSFQQEHKIAQLLRLQEPKAIEWLEFTWEKQATKGLCDPDDRFGRHKGGQRTPKLPSGPLQI